MELVFRALGLAASVNHAMSRHRVNFIPINLVLACVAAALLVFAVDGWREATQNGQDPERVALKDLRAIRPGLTFVRTSGVFFPDAGFQYGEMDSNGNMTRVTMEFVPIVDRETAQAVLLQLPAQHRFGTSPREIEITGMLRPMQEFVARELRTTNFESNGVHLLPTSVLVADEEPGAPASWQLGMTASGTIVGLFILLTLKRNTIFVRGVGSPASAPDAAGDPAAMHATGTFTLGKHTQRFIDVPAVLNPFEDGSIAALANVDASSSFMGMTYSDRSGTWMMHIAPQSIHGIEEGVLYYGWRPMPAIRFTYRDAASNRSRTAILSAPSAAVRAELLAQLAMFRAAA